MEITLFLRIGVHGYSGLYVGFQFQPFLDDEVSVGTDKRRIFTEAFKISFVGSIDIQVVGVGCRNHCCIGGQPVERTVELVGFDYHQVTFVGKQQVGPVVFGNTSQECVTFHMRIVQQVGCHGRSSGFSMGTGYTESFFGPCQHTQHLCAFLDLEAMFTEIGPFLMFFRNGRRVYHQRGSRIFEIVGYK